jgi:hypothetical protein
MGRPRKADGQRTVPVSARLLETGVNRIDEIGETRGTNRTEALATLLGLGLAAWDRGARPPVKRHHLPK